MRWWWVGCLSVLVAGPCWAGASRDFSGATDVASLASPATLDNIGGNNNSTCTRSIVAWILAKRLNVLSNSPINYTLFFRSGQPLLEFHLDTSEA